MAEAGKNLDEIVNCVKESVLNMGEKIKILNHFLNFPFLALNVAKTIEIIAVACHTQIFSYVYNRILPVNNKTFYIDEFSSLLIYHQ